MKNYPEDLLALQTVNPSRDDGFANNIEVDYAAYLRRLKRNWYWFVLTTLIAIGLAWTYLRYTTPVYAANASMLVEEESSANNMGLSKVAIAEELGFENSYEIANELEILRSRRLMERVVDNLGLDVQYFHIGEVKETEVYRPSTFGLFPVVDTLAAPLAKSEISYGSVLVQPRVLDFRLIRGEQDTVVMRYGQPFKVGNRDYKFRRTGQENALRQGEIYSIYVQDPVDVASRYKNALEVFQQGKSRVVNLGLMDAVPEKAKDILNSVINVYSEQIIEEQSKAGAQTLEFLEERLSFVTRQLNAVEYNAAAFKSNQNLGADISTRSQDYLTQINEADATLAELQVKRELVENLRSTLEANPETYRPLPLASEVTSGILSSLISQYNDAIFERETKLESQTENHPSLATSSEKLSSLRQRIILSVGTILEETNERASRIQARIRPLEKRLDNIPENQRRLTQIMREQQIKQNLFMFLLEKREEAALSIAAQVSNTRIIDQAISTSFPIDPKPKMIYFFAICMGLFLPGSTLFLREVLGTKIETEKELRKATNVPIVGRIVTGNDRRQMVLSAKDSRTAIGESFRMLRSNLGYILQQDGPAIITVTSSISGEGKTFVASNLAHSLSLMKKRVVVLGMDLRKPQMGRSIQGKDFQKTQAGLTDYLIGNAKYEDILQETKHGDLQIIQSGPTPPNPSELLLSPRFRELIERLQGEYDVIIVDTPPIGIVADTMVLKDLTDLTLYIVRVGRTPKQSIKTIRELHQSKRMPKVNLVLNDVNPADAYGKYGSGYYVK